MVGGLPAVGKTTLSRLIATDLAAVYLRIDSIEQAMRDGGLTQPIGGAGYSAARAVAADADSKEGTISVLGAFRRLLACRQGVDAIVNVPELGPGVISYAWGCLEWSSLDVCGCAMEVLSALLHCRADPVDMAAELACKRLVLEQSARRELGGAAWAISTTAATPEQQGLAVAVCKKLQGVA